MKIKSKTFKPTLNEFYLGLLTTLLFSSFLYLEYFEITVKVVNTLTAIGALALLLYIPKRSILISGFFIGLLWFYWIGYSFEYNGVGYLTPVITLLFAIIYMLFFGLLALTNNTLIRAALLFALSFIEPMDFNWMQIELLFVDSYIGVFKYQLAILLFALALPSFIKSPYRYAPLLLIVLTFNYTPLEQKESPLKIKLVQTDIAQDKKWTRAALVPTVYLVYSEIEEAIREKYEIVILPESVFPLFMNKSPEIMQELLYKSKDITIIAGSLLYENDQNYNVTYMFKDGEYEVAKKMILVPFGEYIPLPKFAKEFVNEVFFAGASDFQTATKPTDFNIDGIKYRNAICYEATCQELYEGDVDFIIATSNNAWFYPSIEPTLQKLLMRFYARKYGVTIYHSANYKGTGIVK